MSAPVSTPAKASPVTRASSSAGLLLQRKCACGGSASSLTGDCQECAAKKLQKKLSVGASNDPLELEADRVAERALSDNVPRGVSRAPLRVQRLGPAGAGHAGNAPPSVERVLASPGRPLDKPLRQDMEGRFGHDFSRVRVHVGPDASQSARDVSAAAYTVGSHIVFGAGRFEPSRSAGRRLLAHELAHTLQQGHGAAHRVQRASGCGPDGVLGEELNLVGVAAHEQIQDKYSHAFTKRTIPRATKDDKSKRCPGKDRDRGEADLWVYKPSGGIQIGEIKSVVKSSAELGRQEVKHYILRYEQLAGRVTGGQCATKDQDPKDLEFDNTHLGGALQRGTVPAARPLDTVIPAAGEEVGWFKRDPKKKLHCKRSHGGAVLYWCTKDSRRRKKDQANEKRQEARKGDSKLLIPALIGTGLALGASLWAVSGMGKGTGTNAGTKPTTGTTPKAAPPPATTTPVDQPKQKPRAGTRRQHRPPKAAAPRGHKPSGRVQSGSRAPRSGVRTGGGRVGSVGRVGGGVLTLIGVWSLLSSFDDAKDQINAMKGPYDALWDQVEKELAALDAATADADPPAPAVAAPAPPAPPPPAPPPPKMTDIQLFEYSRSKVTERTVSVPTAEIGVRYYPVTFFALSDMGRSPRTFDMSRVDCTKLGTAGFITGARSYSGFAKPGDIGHLTKLMQAQSTMARLVCFSRGARAPTPARPDSDHVTISVQYSGADATGTCERSPGSNWSCTIAGGDLGAVQALLEEDLDTINAPSDFILDVQVVRVRNGKSETWDRNVTAWIEDPDHPMPEPHVVTAGSVPADAVDSNQYPKDSAVRFLLDEFYRWGE